MQRHHLKIDKKFFDRIASGKKRWEYRLNDRNFQVGDILVLHEQTEVGPTGIVLERLVSDIMTALDFPTIGTGHVILSLDMPASYAKPRMSMTKDRYELLKRSRVEHGADWMAAHEADRLLVTCIADGTVTPPWEGVTRQVPFNGTLTSKMTLSEEARVLSDILAGMVEGGYMDLETLYTEAQGDGDAFVKRAAEVLSMLANKA